MNLKEIYRNKILACTPFSTIESSRWTTVYHAAKLVEDPLAGVLMLKMREVEKGNTALGRTCDEFIHLYTNVVE